MELVGYPVLYFKQSTPEFWQLIVTVVSASEPNLIVSTSIDSSWVVAGNGSEKMYAYSFKASRGSQISYACNGMEFDINIPDSSTPIRFGLVACNGFEGENLENPDPDRAKAWQEMASSQEHNPYHLLIHMGDQIYNDGVWECHSDLQLWQKKWALKRYRTPFSESMLSSVRNFYWKNYLLLRNMTVQRKLLAVIPSIMMWDDHDIFDGYGSYRGYDSHAPVVKGIYQEARRAFQYFQTPQNLPQDHMGYRVRIDDLGIIVPDLRSLRTRSQVLGAQGMNYLRESLREFRDCKQIVLVMTVPFVNISLNFLERLLVVIPGQQMYQDDLRDQWRSYAHQSEWLQVAQLLMECIAQSSVQITLVSGEIHLAATGHLQYKGQKIRQYIASGIAHPPPPSLVVKVLNFLARRKEVIAGFHVDVDESDGRAYTASRGYLDGSYFEGNLEISHRFVDSYC